jgi:tetratricopeptide (TPR) repeat protein
VLLKRDKDNWICGKTSFWQKIVLCIFGIFLALALIEIGLNFSGLVLSSWQELRNMLSLKQRGEYRILCLGESTTQYQYPLFLEQILNQNNEDVKFSVIDKGRAGTQSHVILRELENNLVKYRPHMVVAMIGINDTEGHFSYANGHNLKSLTFFSFFKTYKLLRLLELRFAAMQKKTSFNNNELFLEEPQCLLKEGALKKAIALNPTNDRTYVELGRLYSSYSYFSKAALAYEKSLVLNPANDQALVELGIVYLNLDKRAEGENQFKKAIAINPENFQPYYELGVFYLQLSDFSQSELFLKKAISLNKEFVNAYHYLIDVYLRQNKIFESKKTYKAVFNIEGDSEKLKRTALIISSFDKTDEPVQKNINKPEKKDSYLEGVIENYRKIEEILSQRKIRLVCVQYPMRDIMPLKNIFLDKKGIIFVDNENIFKKAVEKEGYYPYFCDIFAGDFGHCTPKGNRLLAENIANSIREVIFNKHLPQ